MLITYEKQILQSTFNATDLVITIVAVVPSITAACNALGRIGYSTISDKMKDRVLVYKIIFASSVLFTGFTLLMWLLSEGSGLYKVSIIALLMVINLGYGGGFSTLPALLSSRFGMNNISKIHGITLSAWAVAGLTGNNMSEVILKATSPSVATRCYDLLLFATIILYAIAFIFSFFTNKKKEKG